MRPAPRTRDTRPSLDTSKPRHRMLDTQTAFLEALYQRFEHPSREERQSAANSLQIDIKIVNTWLQNRRAHVKIKRLSPSARTAFVPRLIAPLSPFPSHLPLEKLTSNIPQSATQPSALEERTSISTFRRISKSTIQDVPSRAPAPPAFRGIETHVLRVERANQAARYAQFGHREVPAYELWTLLPSSSPETSPDLYRGHHFQEPVKRSLDWACRRDAKRRRENPEQVTAFEGSAYSGEAVAGSQSGYNRRAYSTTGSKDKMDCGVSDCAVYDSDVEERVSPVSKFRMAASKNFNSTSSESLSLLALAVASERPRTVEDPSVARGAAMLLGLKASRRLSRI